ncbi:fibronectin-binding protein A N-terminus-domain-containing protein [Chytridium lagenaria]|nr:fibronectin-binding protein A N-terminus-domain-containing protein [Chytridium lagenaria]
MQQRFSALDVAASVSDIRPTLIGLRLQNVYDINPKTYLLKFAKPDSKELLLIESGVRLHATAYEREKSKTPNAFATKLRKYIKTRRLTDIRQVGLDRVVDLIFGEGEYEHHLILEFYASGNIILTDRNFVILAILRSVELSATPATALDNDITIKEPEKDIVEVESRWKGPDCEKAMRDAFSSIYGPALVEHALAASGLDTTRRVASVETRELQSVITSLFGGFQSAENIITGLSSGTHKGGWITQTGGLDDQSGKAADMICPLTNVSTFLAFASFNEAVDEFFSKIEAQKLQLKAKQAEHTATKRLDNVKAGHQAQIAGLERQVVENAEIAAAIEGNLYLIDTIIATVRSFVEAGMDWKDLEDLIEEEAKGGNAAAMAVKGLKLKNGVITVELRSEGSEDEDEDDDDEYDANYEEDEKEKMKFGNKPVQADINIYKSAYANACDYYGSRKVASVKKIVSDLEKTKSTISTIRTARKPFWFEKYNWFVSSENFLVISGKDAQQTDIILRRYIRPHDLVVSSDAENAPMVIIKCPKSDGSPRFFPIGGDGMRVPPLTLQQAGVASLAHSAAWERKQNLPAWWIYPHQVQMSQRGDQFASSTLAFSVTGVKNYIVSTSQVIYGLGVLAAHFSERRPWARDVDASTINFDEPSLHSYATDVTERKHLAGEDCADGDIEAATDTTTLQTSDATAVQQMDSQGVAGEETNVPDSAETSEAVEAVEVSDAEEKEETLDATMHEVDEDAMDGRRSMKKGKGSDLSDTASIMTQESRASKKVMMEVLGAQAKAAVVVKEEEKDMGRGTGRQGGPRVPRPHAAAGKEHREEVELPDDVTCLDLLTGQPNADDTLIFAMPMCAPYSTLGRYKYKAKLVPG